MWNLSFRLCYNPRIFVGNTWVNCLDPSWKGREIKKKKERNFAWDINLPGGHHSRQLGHWRHVQRINYDRATSRLNRTQIPLVILSSHTAGWNFFLSSSASSSRSPTMEDRARQETCNLRSVKECTWHACFWGYMGWTLSLRFNLWVSRPSPRKRCH